MSAQGPRRASPESCKFEPADPGFGDAFNATYMAASGRTVLYSYDADLDRLPDLSRLNP